MIPSILKKRNLGMALALLALIIPASAQEILEESRNALAQLIETKKLIAQERNEWETEKAIILDTIDTLEKQVEAVENRMKEIEDSTSLGEQKRAELQGRLAELQEMTSRFEPVISEYEARLRAFIPYLPDPLMDKIERLVGQLPKAGEAANRRIINNRAVVVIGILDEINNFHNSIQVHRELLNIGGEELFFSTLYYGLSTAYFVDENATLAGVGKPTSDGWTFEAVPGIENDVFDAVQIREKKMLARFVSLPVNVEDININ
jgi:hypothetical protein